MTATASPAPPAPTDPHRSPYDPLTVPQVHALPPIRWQVDGILPECVFGQLFGVSGSGKSLLALDMMLSIAAGVSDWFGAAVKPGRVIYIVGEGLGGISRRIQAWERIHPGANLDRFHIVPNIPALNDPGAVDQLLEALGAQAIRSAAWVVWDTFARAIPGVDENSAAEVGLAISGAGRVAAELKAGTLLVHHAGHNTTRERGSTALRAACDTVLSLSEDDGRHVLRVVKQRDGDPGDPLYLKMASQPPSVVFHLADAPASKLTDKQRTLLEILRDGGPMTHKSIVERGPISRSYASDLVRSLFGEGMIDKSDDLYRLTSRGSEALACR